ncbi:MAG TPA: hypothetical protein VNJ03_15910 [Vicinamibacterales bacterium]|nr:hypothetical protein [Vicinamibacterales bacterium]
MRPVPLFFTVLLFALGALAPAASLSAQTLTTRDIVELSKAGLAEDILLALIEVNRSVFPVDRATLTSLKRAGVSPNVIVAMVRSGREEVPLPAPVSPPIVHHDSVSVVHDDDERARSRELERELERAKDREREWEHSRGQRRQFEVVIPVAVPIYIPVPVYRREPIQPAEPVYWGWGGKLRPDAWKPAEIRSEPRDPYRDRN